MERHGGGRREGGVLLAEHDGVCAPGKFELGEGVGDGSAPDGEDGGARCGGVDLDGLGADDECIVVCKVDALYAVIGLGRG